MIASRPTPAFAYSHPAHVIAFGFGAGLARFAPGTFGTLAGWPSGGCSGRRIPALIFSLVAALFRVGVWACGVTGRHLGVPTTARWCGTRSSLSCWWRRCCRASLEWQLAGFVLFRAFDIGKPPPIRWLERRYGRAASA